jgi:RimJ/RimL family protein N-acetyltransferase
MGLYPPELIELDDFVLRRSGPEDGDLIAATVAANLEHVRPFMPWANEESASAAFQRTRSLTVVKEWDERASFEYLAVGPADVHLGNFGLHRRIGPDAIELGYWLTREAQGHGYATRSARALTAAALALDDVSRVEIHCDEANARSAAVPARLGYRMDRVIDVPPRAPRETGRQTVWVYPAE